MSTTHLSGAILASARPAGAVSKLLTLITILDDIDGGLSFLQHSVAAIGVSAKPLLSLIVLMAGLNVMESVIEEFSLPGVGTVISTYLTITSWVAYTMAQQFITHFMTIEAAVNGIEIPPDCMIEL